VKWVVYKGGLMTRLLSLLIFMLLVSMFLPASGLATVAYQTSAHATRAGNPIWVANDDGSSARSLGFRGDSVAISPDGSKVAYVRGAYGDNLSLVIATIATGAKVVVLSSAPLSSYPGPVWSPDSTHLLAATETASREGYVTGDGVVVIDATTGVASTIVAAKGNNVGGFSWSPTGTQIAYDLERFTVRYKANIVVANADGSQAVMLGRGINPIWGPRLIAFQRITRVAWYSTYLYHAQVWTIDPALGKTSARKLTHFRGHPLINGPSASQWTPDGKTLIGTISGDDVVQPIRINVGNGRIRHLRDGRNRPLDDAVPVAVSADGATLLLQSGVISAPATFEVMRLAGGAAHAVLRGSLSISTSPSWQP